MGAPPLADGEGADTSVMTTTAFGASWDLPPASTAAVLRAQAAATLPVLPATTVDAAAATVAAHVWATVTGESSLRGAHRHTAPEIAVAAAVLARAAGHRVGPTTVDHDDPAAATSTMPGQMLGPGAARGATSAVTGTAGTDQGSSSSRDAATALEELPRDVASTSATHLDVRGVPTQVHAQGLRDLLEDCDLALDCAPGPVLRALGEAMAWVRQQQLGAGTVDDVLAAAAADLAAAAPLHGGAPLVAAAQLLATEAALLD